MRSLVFGRDKLVSEVVAKELMDRPVATSDATQQHVHARILEEAYGVRSHSTRAGEGEARRAIVRGVPTTTANHATIRRLVVIFAESPQHPCIIHLHMILLCYRLAVC